MKPKSMSGTCNHCGRYYADDVLRLCWCRSCPACYQLFTTHEVVPEGKLISAGKKVYYHGLRPWSAANTGAVLKGMPDYFFDVQFLDGRILRLSGLDLFPACAVDDDVAAMSWGQLLDEVAGARSFFRWLLSQKGDDLCWRDFYEGAARLLPEVHDLHSLATCPPKSVMLGNCSRFIDSIKGGEPYKPLGVPPLTPETAVLPPATAIEVTIKVHRPGRSTEVNTATSRTPGFYCGNEDGQILLYQALDRCIVSLDRLERHGSLPEEVTHDDGVAKTAEVSEEKAQTPGQGPQEAAGGVVPADSQGDLRVL